MNKIDKELVAVSKATFPHHAVKPIATPKMAFKPKPSTAPCIMIFRDKAKDNETDTKSAIHTTVTSWANIFSKQADKIDSRKLKQQHVMCVKLISVAYED